MLPASEQQLFRLFEMRVSLCNPGLELRYPGFKACATTPGPEPGYVDGKTKAQSKEFAQGHKEKLARIQVWDLEREFGG